MCTLYEQSEWHNRLGGNVQAESVIDRIVHNCVDIVLGDLNMRAYTSQTKMKKNKDEEAMQLRLHRRSDPFG